MTAFPDQHGVRPPGGISAGASPDVTGVRTSDAPLLGRLLVERGLLGEEQLAAGLAEQERTGAPLGKVLIDLGFVDGAIVALALATQHGGLLKTEYGVATGFPTVEPGTPVVDPPLGPAPTDGTPVSSAPDLRMPAPAAPTGGLPPAEPPSQVSVRESPHSVVADDPPEEEERESAQVEPEADLEREIESVPVEPDGTTDSDGSAGWNAPVEDGRETTLSAEPQEGTPGVAPAEFGDADEARVDLDALAGRNAEPQVELASDPEAELASAGRDRELRSRISVLEGDLDAARVALETAKTELRTAKAAAEIAAARIEQLEQELASARNSDRTLRSENDLLRAVAFEQTAEGRDTRDRLLHQRLKDIEQRLDTASAQLAALHQRSISG
jgi:hypothetical protein